MNSLNVVSQPNAKVWNSGSGPALAQVYVHSRCKRDDVWLFQNLSRE